MALSKTRSLARHWEALLAQLRSVRVDVTALKRALKAADEVEDDDVTTATRTNHKLIGCSRSPINTIISATSLIRRS